MSLEQRPKFCKVCGKKTIHERQGINHIFHFILTILTLGAWFFVWMMFVFFGTLHGWNCRKCMG